MTFDARATLPYGDGRAETLMAGALQAAAAVAIVEHAAFAQHTPTAETVECYLQTRGTEIAKTLLNERRSGAAITETDALHTIRRAAGMLLKLADALERNSDDETTFEDVGRTTRPSA